MTATPSPQTGQNLATVLHQLGVDPARGLADAEAARRFAEHGPNQLIERGRKSPWRILWEQFTATMVVILIIAAVISAALGEFIDAGAILAIIILNAILGFTQENRAEKAMAALKQLAAPTVRVRRDGHLREIAATALVPGDIVSVEAGNFIPADASLVEAANLRVQEAALTGESAPVEKDVRAVVATDAALGDRANAVFMGTVVTYGRATVVVTATGMETELGRIATMIQTVEREPTPLQRRLDHLGKVLAVVALVIVAVVFALGLLRGDSLTLLFLTAVSMAVAAVPEGLPAVVTIALALGAQRMLKRRALIRKLPAVETLGSVTVICSDKTGTLTENRMTVAVVEIAGCQMEATMLSEAALRERPEFARLLVGAALCNDAVMDGAGAVGDPTETALVVAAAKCGLRKAELERALPRVGEVPFESERKRMTTVHRKESEAVSLAGLHGDAPGVSFTKGAVGSLLQVSSHVWSEGRAEPINDAWRERIQTANDRLAQRGMRVLGVAFRPLAELPGQTDVALLERDLIFIGFVGMMDPLRAEARDAVQTCVSAGIRPVMITGDHPLTAMQIARELGIAGDGHVMTGQELERLSVAELKKVVGEVSVYARVAPAHKLKIVEALQSRGQVVAMTGDGINDAPALKKADIGVAMGIAGTDVAKEASAMVLMDDNFATIVAAVREGRVIYDNIRKFIKYIATTNAAEIWLMLLAPLAGMPLPLLPLQILWMNLMTDGLPALALGVEPAEHDVMRRPPQRAGVSIFADGMGWHIAWVGVLMGLLSLATGYYEWHAGNPHWQTMVFTTVTVAQLAHALAIRSWRTSLFTQGLMSNKPLAGAVAVSLALQLAVIYLPPCQRVFKTVALDAAELGLCIALAGVIFVVVELEKWLRRRRAADNRRSEP